MKAFIWPLLHAATSFVLQPETRTRFVGEFKEVARTTKPWQSLFPHIVPYAAASGRNKRFIAASATKACSLGQLKIVTGR